MTRARPLTRAQARRAYRRRADRLLDRARGDSLGARARELWPTVFMFLSFGILSRRPGSRMTWRERVVDVLVVAIAASIAYVVSVAHQRGML